jgi:ubiquitin C-terminal hydrolase
MNNSLTNIKTDSIIAENTSNNSVKPPDVDQSQMIDQQTILNNSNESVKPTKESREEILERITTRGLSGITNVGNTCYMNAALQALSATDTFLAYLIHPESVVKDELNNRALDAYVSEEEKKMPNKNVDSNDDIDVDIEMIENNAKRTITKELRLLYKYMWSENSEIKPGRLKRAINRILKDFRGSKQHDSQEFLSALLDQIHNETKGKGDIEIVFTEDEQKMVDILHHIHSEQQTLTNLLSKSPSKEESEIYMKKQKELNEQLFAIKKNNKDMFLKLESIKTWSKMLSQSYSIINDIFSSLTLTTIRCTLCLSEYYKFDRSDMLWLSFPDSYKEREITLEQLLSHMSDPEKLDGANQYNCLVCGQKRDVEKFNQIYYSPDKLVILIKKYTNIGTTILKNNTLVKYPHILDMEPFMTPRGDHVGHGTDKTGKYMYELYAAIRHSGCYGGGHYYAFSKSGLNGMWFCFDDGDVYGVEENEVLCSNSYVLFYQRIYQ